MNNFISASLLLGKKRASLFDSKRCFVSPLARLLPRSRLFCCVEEMANAASSTAESEALKVAFDYLVNSINTVALLPKALSSQLISERQRSECASEPDPYEKAEKFLGHLQRAVNGDSNKYHTFIQVLKETGQASIASRLGGE